MQIYLLKRKNGFGEVSVQTTAGLTDRHDRLKPTHSLYKDYAYPSGKKKKNKKKEERKKKEKGQQVYM